MPIRPRPPVWFRIVALLLSLWGIAGVVACIQQFRLGADAMGPADAYARALYASLPIWYDPVYAVATGAGLLAAMALVAGSARARPLFIVSTVAILIQFGWLFATTDIIAVRGAASVVPFPLVILAIALFGVHLATDARRRGWIG